MIFSIFDDIVQYENLSKILSKPNEQINSMSHPLGSYNETSLEILKSLKVLLGFRDNMFVNNKIKMLVISVYFWLFLNLNM